MQSADLRLKNLALKQPAPVEQRPQGLMAAWLGRQYSVEEFDDPDRYWDEERLLLPLIRAYEVPALLGATFQFRVGESISASLQTLLQSTLPGIEW